MRRRPQSKSPMKETGMSQATGDLENSFDKNEGSQESSSVEPLLDKSYTEEIHEATKLNLYSPRSQAGGSRCLVGGITVGFGVLLILLTMTGKFRKILR